MDRMTVQGLQPRGGDLERPVNQINLGTPQMGGLGQKHTHGPTAAIGQRSGRIQGFHRRASRHQKTPSLPIALSLSGIGATAEQAGSCLLYTSDAADE